MQILIISSLTLTAIVSYFIGKYIERIKWNKLIEKGILPKPKTNKIKKQIKQIKWKYSLI